MSQYCFSPEITNSLRVHTVNTILQTRSHSPLQLKGPQSACLSFASQDWPLSYQDVCAEEERDCPPGRLWSDRQRGSSGRGWPSRERGESVNSSADVAPCSQHEARQGSARALVARTSAGKRVETPRRALQRRYPVRPGSGVDQTDYATRCIARSTMPVPARGGSPNACCSSQTKQRPGRAARSPLGRSSRARPCGGAGEPRGRVPQRQFGPQA